MISSPSKSDYKAMVNSNMIRNCPVTQYDVSNARNIFGPQFEGVHGKIMLSKPEQVVEEHVVIPRDFFLQNK